MFGRRCSLHSTSLFQVLLLCIPFVAAQLTTPKSTEEDLDAKIDRDVKWVIVAIALLFAVTVTVVIMVSLYQTRRDPAPTKRRSTSTDHKTTTSFAEHQVDRLANVADQSSTSAGNMVVEDSNNYEEMCTWWEIPADKLAVYGNNVLGSGQFGVILLGHVNKDNYPMKCAVKTLKPDASAVQVESLKEELRNMSNMDPHPNIVNLIGAQTVGVFYVVVEYCENGDLINYVRKNKNRKSWQGQNDDTGTSIEYVKRLRIAFDIANGMDYLATKGFIHRDLAARNVLLNGEMRAKVSDFGRSRDVRKTFGKKVQSIRKNEPVPTRWMPVETLRRQVFTAQSDVWSFGVLLWEIESGGERPYDDQQTYRQVVNKVVHEGYRLQQPFHCPDVIYQIMLDCWKVDPEERPTFYQIAQNLGNLLTAHLSTPPPLYDSPM